MAAASYGGDSLRLEVGSDLCLCIGGGSGGLTLHVIGCGVGFLLHIFSVDGGFPFLGHAVGGTGAG